MQIIIIIIIVTYVIIIIIIDLVMCMQIIAYATGEWTMYETFPDV